MNGPFAIVVARPDMMLGFTDRIKLRPLVAGENGSKLYISSEEAASSEAFSGTLATVPSGLSTYSA
jgi:glutamate synthase domain-containing protein 1